MWSCSAKSQPSAPEVSSDVPPALSTFLTTAVLLWRSPGQWGHVPEKHTENGTIYFLKHESDINKDLLFWLMHSFPWRIPRCSLQRIIHGLQQQEGQGKKAPTRGGDYVMKRGYYLLNTTLNQSCKHWWLSSWEPEDCGYVLSMTNRSSQELKQQLFSWLQLLPGRNLQSNLARPLTTTIPYLFAFLPAGWKLFMAHNFTCFFWGFRMFTCFGLGLVWS